LVKAKCLRERNLERKNSKKTDFYQIDEAAESADIIHQQYLNLTTEDMTFGLPDELLCITDHLFNQHYFLLDIKNNVTSDGERCAKANANELI